MALIFSILVTPYIYYWLLASLVLFSATYLLNKSDSKSFSKKINGLKTSLERLTDELELEKSFPRTTMIRLLAPYHSFKADLVDGKAIITEKQGRKMVVIGEKTVDECISDFKNIIGTFEIIRAQICLRIDYSKDDFKWFEIEDLKERLV